MKGFIHKNVPYFSQWESRGLVKDFVSGKKEVREDPLWKNSGAKTPEEYELWSRNGCGVACLKMILVHKLGIEIPLVKLGLLCKKYGGYRGERLEGLYYKPFLNFIEKEFGLSGKIISPMTIKDIIRELKRGNYVIASVHYSIRNSANEPAVKGGHLVLIVGYKENELVFHNPSGHTKKAQEYSKISFNDFKKFFAGRGIVING